jgi:hypothetical protein
MISILNSGGLASLLVGEEGAEEIGNLKATPSSANDIEVMLDDQVGKIGNRALFQVRSISGKTGIYTITFESSCGKKTVKVRVR